MFFSVQRKQLHVEWKYCITVVLQYCRPVEYSRGDAYGDVGSAADWVIPRVLSSRFP